MSDSTLEKGVVPALKRPRVGERTMLACISCKQRKLKCDGRSPTCSNCLKNGRECLVEDPATGLARPRDYMQTLEAHVAQLEALLRQVRPDVALDHLPLTGPTDVVQQPAQSAQSTEQIFQFDQRHMSPPYQPAQPSALPENASKVGVNSLDSNVAMLCLNATGREPYYFGSSSTVSFSRIASQTMRLDERHNRKYSGSSEMHTATTAQSNSEVARLFPTSELAKSLSTAYFENIHPQYPFLHRPTFLQWEQQCLKASETGHVLSAGHTPLFFVLMVYSIASLAHGPNNYYTAENLYSAAMDHINPILDSNSLETVQSILCCAVYSVRSPIGASLWQLSGMAIRHCVELGYHRSAETYRRHTNPLVKEMSKRCFWVAYDMDRVASVTLGRPQAISDLAIDAELPWDIDDEKISRQNLQQGLDPVDTVTDMTGAIHVIKLRRIWSKISSQLYSINSTQTSISTLPQKDTLQDLRLELDAWHDSVPHSLIRSDSKPMSVFASRQWFQLAYDHSILLIYRPFITCLTTSARYDEIYEANEDFGATAMYECYQKAGEICMLYRRTYQTPGIQFTWGSLHILFSGGLTYLYCLWQSASIREQARRTEIINTCMACTTVLVIIAERWELAGPYRDVFESLSERTISMVCGDESQPTTSDGGEQAQQEVGPSHNLLNMSDAWSSAIEQTAIPQESAWLLQELLQGFTAFDSLEGHNS